MPRISNSEYEHLLPGFRAGYEKDFSELFHALYPALCYHALKITRDQATAEEIASEAFVKVWERRDIFYHFNVLKSYLYTTVKNASINWLLKTNRQNLSKQQMAFLETGNDRLILESLIEAETLRLIYSEFETLPSQCRKIMKMIFIEGKKIREVADELGLSFDHVKNQKRRGFALLRKRLPDLAVILAILSMDY